MSDKQLKNVMKQLINKIEKNRITSTNELIKLVTREFEQGEYHLIKDKIG